MTDEELKALAERVKHDIAWLPEYDQCREAQDALRLAVEVLRRLESGSLFTGCHR